MVFPKVIYLLLNSTLIETIPSLEWCIHLLKICSHLAVLTGSKILHARHTETLNHSHSFKGVQSHLGSYCTNSANPKPIDTTNCDSAGYYTHAGRSHGHP